MNGAKEEKTISPVEVAKQIDNLELHKDQIVDQRLRTLLMKIKVATEKNGTLSNHAVTIAGL